MTDIAAEIPGEIQELERQRIRAMTTMDAATLDRVLADDFCYIHASSAKDNKQSFINAILSGALLYRSVETSEIEVRDLGEIFLMIGKAEVTVALSGRRQVSNERFTAGYRSDKGQWQMQFWQSTGLK